MIVVDVIIAECVDKVTDPKICNVCDEMCQQRIRTDIERHAEKRVGGTLVKLAVKNATVLDLELKQRVTRRQIDVISLARIPTGHDQSARIRIRLDLSNQICDLVHSVFRWIVSTKR